MDSGSEVASCPSAQPDMDEARVFGVVTEEREGQRIAYLAPETDVDPALLAGLDGVAPTEVFRFSAKCETSRCSHFDGARCTLAERIQRALAPVVDRLPACTVRATCRWYLEQGGEICLRCPQVVTLNVGISDRVLREAATPPV